MKKTKRTGFRFMNNKENQFLEGNVFHSCNEPKHILPKRRGNTTNKAIYGDDKLKYVTKVHLERMPLQNLLNYQQTCSLRNRQCNFFYKDVEAAAVINNLNNSKEQMQKNISHCSEIRKGGTEITEREKENINLKQTVTTRKSNRLKEKHKHEVNNIENQCAIKKRPGKEKTGNSRKSNGTVDKEKQTQKVIQIDKSPKKMLSNYKDNNYGKNIQNSMIVTSNKNIACNKSNTLKTPIYKQFQIETDNEYHNDEYDFIVSPNNTRYKSKKRRRNKAQTPISFHLFSVPKFTKTKPRRRRVCPPILKAYLTVGSKREKKVDTSKCNSSNNNFTSILINNNKEPRVPKPLTNLKKVITDIKSNIRSKNEKKISSNEQEEILLNIEHDNEFYDSEGISNNEDNVHITEPLNVKDVPQKCDKTIDEEIATCFGFNENNKFSLKNPNLKEISNNILRSPCVTDNLAFESPSTPKTLNNKKVKILSNILINPSVPDKTVNENSPSLFENSNSTLNDTKDIQSKCKSMQDTIDDSFTFDHLPKKGPGANSTMIRPSNNEKSFSWRLDEHLFQHNPHFLMLKQSSLPVTDQDSIIDHTFDDSICQNTKKSVQNNKDDKNTEKSVVQKSILDFVKSSGKQDFEPEMKRVSFFNIDELSPLKESQQQNLPERSPGSVKRNLCKMFSPKKNSPSNKENVNVNSKIRFKRQNKENSPRKHPSFNSFDKENNLENKSFSKNKNSESSVIENLSPIVVLKKLDLTLLRERKLNLTDDFGFDSLLFDDIAKNRDNKQAPTRFSIRKIKKILISNNSNKEEIKAASEKSSKEIINDSDCDSDAPQEANDFPKDKMNVGLFEDPKPDSKSTAKKYERKRPGKRKQRFYSVESDTEHMVVNAPKKKKKDIISKEEEEEFEKWAAEFNSECKEVDKFDLEIVKSHCQ